MSATRSERLSMDEGSEVEVCYKKKSFKAVWYKAIIERNRSKELSLRLLKDEFPTRLVLATEVFFFRPVPPPNMRPDISIVRGSVVDAYHKGGWWTGLVIKEIDDDKCLVFFDSLPEVEDDDDKSLVLFDSLPDVVQFERKDLRLHFDWVDEQWRIPPLTNVELLRRLMEECVFSSGTMVEVKCKRDEMETFWVPAMVVKEIESGDEKKCIVKFCESFLSFKGSNSRANKAVDLLSIRPRPPPFSVEEFQLPQDVEVFHGKEWRQGRLMRNLLQERCLVHFEATNEELVFKQFNLRPLKVWEDGVWKTKESLLSQASGNKRAVSAMNGTNPSLAKEAVLPVTSSPGIAQFPWKLTVAETQGNTFFTKKTFPPTRMHIGSGNVIKQENDTSDYDSRKRKREQYASMVLPFEKRLPIWKTFESMEVFKIVPQTPHFSPLLEMREESREIPAVGLMFTYAALIQELKDLQLFSPLSTIIGLSNSFAMLENHGFDIKAPKSRIQTLLSLRDKQAKILEERKVVEKEITEKESEKVENKRKILELQRMNVEADKEIAEMKFSAATIDQELKEVEFEATLWYPW